MILQEHKTEIIRRYTDPNRIDQQKLTAYIEKHRTIKEDVFEYCTRVSKRTHEFRGYCSMLTSGHLFTPVDRDTFFRRIPFFFHQMDFSFGKESGLLRVIPREKECESCDFEEFCRDLEWMFYELKIPLDTIFSYIHDQLFEPQKPVSRQNRLHGLAQNILDGPQIAPRRLFEQWRHYLHLCSDLGWTDYTPMSFITSYNRALEASGIQPIIYDPLSRFHFLNAYFTRDENTYVCEGYFPCDSEGIPIWDWTSIRVKNAENITYSGIKSRYGELKIVLGPLTTIHALLSADDEGHVVFGNRVGAEWYQVYAGPQTMEFDHAALKEIRMERKMTQNDVAKAIGASVRTYQKWENGETTPDGHYLLRLMNWLNIDDCQALIKYNNTME